MPPDAKKSETDLIDPPSDQVSDATADDGVSDTTASQTAESAEKTGQSEPTTMAEAISAALDQKTSEDPDDPDSSGEDADGDLSDEKGSDAEDAPDKGAKKPGKQPEPEDDDDDAELEDPTEEELGQFKPQVRRRVKQLLSQRSMARAEAAELQPDAGRYRSLQKYMSENDLGDTEFADLLIAGADLKSGEPQRLQSFLDRVLPLVQQALVATGQMVPSDLTEQVESGEMTEDAALAIARSKATAAAAQQRAEKAERNQTAYETAQANANVQQTVLSAVDRWRLKTRQSDPDFDQKQDVMTTYAQALVAQRGPARTSEEAVAYSQEVYEQVNRLFERARPARKATRPTPAPGTSTPRSSPTAEPASLEDVIRQSLAQAG